MSSNSSRSDYHSFELPYQNSGFDAELAHVRERRRGGGCCFFGCCLGCCGFLLLIALAIFALWYCFFSGGAALVVSPETTIITEPLKSDGRTVDFHRAIQAMIEPDVPTSENGFRDVMLAFGQQIFGADGNTDEWYRAMCERLDIDPQTPPKFVILDPNDPRNIHFASEELDVIQTAAAKPHYFVPLVRLNEMDFVFTSQPHGVYAFHATATPILRQRAINRFNTDVEGAWKDMLATIRLFRTVTINQAWLQSLSGIDRELLLTPVSDVIPLLHHWTPEQLKQAIKDLESLPHWQDRQTTLRMMQFTLLDMLSAMDDVSNLSNRLRVSLPVEAEMEGALAMASMIGIDWNLVAKELNAKIKEYGDRWERSVGNSLEEQFALMNLRLMDEPLRHPLTNLNEKYLEDFFTEHIQDVADLPVFASGRSRLTGIFAGTLVEWGAGEMYRLQLMEESRCQALRLALALELYRRTHQTYPDSREELELLEGFNLSITPDMYIEYEKWGDGYHLHNMIFQLDVL